MKLSKAKKIVKKRATEASDKLRIVTSKEIGRILVAFEAAKSNTEKAKLLAKVLELQTRLEAIISQMHAMIDGVKVGIEKKKRTAKRSKR